MKHDQGSEKMHIAEHRGKGSWVLRCDGVFYALMLVLGLVALIPRIEVLSTALSGKYLWAEDAPVFLNMAQANGWSAIFESYAGYLHFYPKIVAHFATYFDLVHRPAILFLSWLLAYGLMVYAAARAARTFGASWVVSAIAVLLLAFQPAAGDVLFNITNAQWMLGGAMMLLVLVDTQPTKLQSIGMGVMLLPMALTGPFSIVLAPLICLKVLINADWRRNQYIYVPVFLGALVQAFFILKTGRATYLETSTAPWDFIVAFLQLALFGADTVTTLIAAAIFWTATVWASLRNTSPERTPLLLILAAGFLLILAALYSVKNSPMSAVFLGSGNRFTWIPYALFFVYAILVTRQHRVLQCCAVGSAILLCFFSFKVAPYYDYQFQSFAKLSKVKPVWIPINPPGGYFVEGTTRSGPFSTPVAPPNFHSDEFETGSIIELPLGGRFQFKATGGDPMLIFKNPIHCASENASDVAIEIEMDRSHEGPVQLLWNSFQGFTEKKSLTRLYPKGEIKMLFAFPISGENMYVRLDPIAPNESMRINEIRLYCLE